MNQFVIKIGQNSLSGCQVRWNDGLAFLWAFLINGPNALCLFATYLY